MMAASKALSGKSTHLYHLSFGIHWLSFLVKVEFLLVLGMTSEPLLYFGHPGVLRGSVYYLNLLTRYTSSDTMPECEGSSLLIVGGGNPVSPLGPCWCWSPGGGKCLINVPWHGLHWKCMMVEGSLLLGSCNYFSLLLQQISSNLFLFKITHHLTVFQVRCPLCVSLIKNPGIIHQVAFFARSSGRIYFLLI